METSSYKCSYEHDLLTPNERLRPPTSHIHHVYYVIMKHCQVLRAFVQIIDSKMHADAWPRAEKPTRAFETELKSRRYRGLKRHQV